MEPGDANRAKTFRIERRPEGSSLPEGPLFTAELDVGSAAPGIHYCRIRDLSVTPTNVDIFTAKNAVIVPRKKAAP